MKASMKLKNITSVRNTIISMIDSDESIKRLMFYLTQTPLEQQGTDLNNNTVEQPDIAEVAFTCDDEKRIYTSFSTTVLSELKVIVFVRRWECDLSDLAIGKNKLVIDICVPTPYSVLNETDDRECLIANALCDKIDGENIGGIGKASVVYAKDSIIDTDKQYNVLSLFVDVSTSNFKVNKPISR